MIKLIGIILPIFLTTVLVTGAITVTFFSFIIINEAESKGISEKTELLSFKTTKNKELLHKKNYKNKNIFLRILFTIIISIAICILLVLLLTGPFLSVFIYRRFVWSINNKK